MSRRFNSTRKIAGKLKRPSSVTMTRLSHSTDDHLVSLTVQRKNAPLSPTLSAKDVSRGKVHRGSTSTLTVDTELPSIVKVKKSPSTVSFNVVECIFNDAPIETVLVPPGSKKCFRRSKSMNHTETTAYINQVNQILQPDKLSTSLSTFDVKRRMSDPYDVRAFQPTVHRDMHIRLSPILEKEPQMALHTPKKVFRTESKPSFIGYIQEAR
ncbi:hypothetical protein PROFUN_01918 [Planoprotostelium fungivorum]|uniref:Uncharacterized protein n=1 Tax=Planoprotostelium fungivorum TaxID=1890364 RepID=A0A2P6NZ57_9EUKA|nr:hypothetical protein PROFUN_01918 [Planoprotostelium fungivorum]